MIEIKTTLDFCGSIAINLNFLHFVLKWCCLGLHVHLLQEITQTHLKGNFLGNHFAEKFYVDNYLNTYD